MINIQDQTVVGLQSTPAAEHPTYIIIKPSHTAEDHRTFKCICVYHRARFGCLSVCGGLADNQLWPLEHRVVKYNVQPETQISYQQETYQGYCVDSNTTIHISTHQSVCSGDHCSLKFKLNMIYSSISIFCCFILPPASD